MPGFNIGGTGEGPSGTLEPLFNHRWLITECGTIKRGSLLLAKDVTLPNFRVDRQEVLGGFISYKYAKSVKWDDAEIVFYDDGGIINSLEEWRRLVFDVTTGIKTHAPSNGYKKQCVIELLDGQGQNVNTYTLVNAWPVSINQGKLTYTNSEIKVVTLVLSYDYATSAF